MKRINVYLIARISKEAHLWSDKICDNLNPNTFSVFKPKDNNPWDKRHETFSKEVFEMDLTEMKRSHLGLMLPEYGRDCSWEAGWYSNSEKPLVVFADSQVGWLRDWMVKGGTDYIITSNPTTFNILEKDPILKHKELILINQIRGLNKTLYKIYQKHYKD